MQQKNAPKRMPTDTPSKFRSLKFKLEVTFLSFLLLMGCIIMVTFWFDYRRSEIDEFMSLVGKINFNVVKIQSLEKDFFSNETINPEYYRKGDSPYLKERKKRLREVLQQLQTLENRKEISNLAIQMDIADIRRLLVRYETRFDSLILLINLRGFKDFGVEGRMRRYIHRIESSPFPFDKEKMLMIRRYEKDFIIRKEKIYIAKLLVMVDSLRRDIALSVRNPEERDKMIALLTSYRDTFTQLVTYEEKIGLKKGDGLLQEFSVLSLEIQKSIDHIQKEATEKSLALKERIKLTLIGVVLLCIVSNILLSLFVTQYLSKPVRKLSNSIHKVIKNNFSESIKLEQVKSNDEIGWLSNDFAKMLETVQNNIAQIQLQSDQIAHSQEKIMDSIRYGQQIQEAVLPTEEELNAFFEDSFVIYKPQKLVSGDFYWLFRKKRRTFIAVVDCTGHGVPGAFMSMIGHTLLNKIVGQSKIYDPAMILEVLHIEIKNALHQQEGKNSDGMDICLCCIDDGTDQKIVTFAGAKRTLYYTKNGKLHLLKGDKRGIGGRQKSENQPFNNQVLSLRKGEILYLTTDGFADQNNAAREKFGSLRFAQTLEQVHRQSLSRQKEILERFFEAHKQKEPQRDDVTIVGIKL
ncbi:SpoIIE family protein phosphatase [Hugenholtzia roseola]|uniref:SpoIIE family protein phosphatase n=1 Tax=Hugenholtzia roseola TaxID=1002 RepID=UPI000479B2D3|nr:SpoIIE family protein phosphatase [Hugenholtzia roseola]